MPETPLPRVEVAPVLPEHGNKETEHTSAVPVERGHEVPSIDSTAVNPIPVPLPGPAPLTPVAAPLQHHVEDIMSEGLGDTYAKLDAATQEKFRLMGEQTAGRISTLLASGKVQVKKIVDLLVAWLRIIPGVNNFFLEQEAKIKADKLLALKNKP